MSRPLLLMITGSVPGLGKTSLAQNLSNALTKQGVDVELFKEEDILEREEFATQIRQWRKLGSADEQAMLDAASAYLGWCSMRNASVYVLDALFPYLPSLLAWGWSDRRVMEFMARLAEEMTVFDVLQVHLEGDARTSLKRAVQREGDEWLRWFTEKVRGYLDLRQPIQNHDSLLEHLDHESSVSRDLLRDAPWSVASLSADEGADAVLDQVMQLVAGHIY